MPDRGTAADLLGTHAVGTGTGVQAPPAPDLQHAADGLRLSTPAESPDAPLPGSGALGGSDGPAPPSADWSAWTTSGSVSGSTSASGPHGSVTAAGTVTGTVGAGSLNAVGGTDTDGTATVRSVSGTALSGSAYAGGEVSATTAPVPGVPTVTLGASAAVKVDGALGSVTIMNPDRTDPATVVPPSQITTTGARLGVEAGVSVDGRVSVPLGGAPTSPSLDVYGGVRAGVTGSVTDGAPATFTPRADGTVGAEVVVPLNRDGLDLRAGYSHRQDFLTGGSEDTGYVRIQLTPGSRRSEERRQDEGTVVDVVPEDLQRLAGMHASRAEVYRAASTGMTGWTVPDAGHPLAGRALADYLARHAAALEGHARRDAGTGERVAAAGATYGATDDSTAAGLARLPGRQA